MSSITISAPNTGSINASHLSKSGTRRYTDQRWRTIASQECQTDVPFGVALLVGDPMPSKAQDDVQAAHESPGYYSYNRRRGTVCWLEANLLDTLPRFGKMLFVGVARRISIPQGGYSVRLYWLAPASSDARKRHSCKEPGP
jgi:hypothetical protein